MRRARYISRSGDGPVLLPGVCGDADFHEVFTDDQFSRIALLRFHPSIAGVVSGSQMGQEQGFGSRGLGHRADLFDGCVGEEKMLDETILLRGVGRFAKEGLHPVGIDDFMNENVRVLG